MQNNMTRAVLPAVMLLSTFITPNSAQELPGNLTVEQLRKLEQYILDYIKILRVSETQPQPPMLEEFNQKYTELCYQRAVEEYKKHGRWFYCEDNKEFRDGIRWDECVTYGTYSQLLRRYGSLEKIPHYQRGADRLEIDMKVDTLIKCRPVLLLGTFTFETCVGNGCRTHHLKEKQK